MLKAKYEEIFLHQVQPSLQIKQNMAAKIDGLPLARMNFHQFSNLIFMEDRDSRARCCKYIPRTAVFSLKSNP